jgi:hypothetical protein
MRDPRFFPHSIEPLLFANGGGSINKALKERAVAR